MSVEPLSEAEAFYNLLGERLSVGERAQSLDERLTSWRQQRERRETIAAVEAGVRDAEAGRIRPLRDIIDELPHDALSAQVAD